MKMRAVAVFTGMLTGVLSVTGLLSAGAYAAGEKGICLHPRRRQTPEYSRCIWGPRGWFTTRPRRGDADGD